MEKHGKRYRAAAKKIDTRKEYDFRSAIAAVKETAKAKFDESFDISLRLGVDPRKAVDGIVAGRQLAGAR